METAAELDADLIVLGRRGRGGFPSLPIGTTAHHVAGASGRPIVVVPIDDAPAATPFVQRVVVGLDGLPGSDEAVRWAARHFEDAHFTAVHALELAPSLAAPDEVGSLYERARKRTTELMRTTWCDPLFATSTAFDTVVEIGRAAEVILGSAERTAAHLVVLGRRDYGPLRGTLGGVSQRVLAYAPCAAAIVPYPGRGDLG
jgi:nucleotide-binding universal stress UspA family protein